MMRATVECVETVCRQTGKSARIACAGMGLVYSNIMRWKSRGEKGLRLLNRPGPAKVRPINFRQLTQEMRRLAHGRKRSAGAVRLYEKHREQVSRREYAAALHLVRSTIERERVENQYRIAWLKVGVCWAMDAARYNGCGTYHLQQTEELCSRYKFPAIAGRYEPVGEEIGGYLDAQFTRHGAPLFLKRDNGGNQNHSCVNAVMEKHMVLPLNSPFHYAPYNGAVERAQRELKAQIDRGLSVLPHHPDGHFEVYADQAVNVLNHTYRRVMKGQNSCQCFFNAKNQIKFTRVERREIYEWIKDKSRRILLHMPNQQKDAVGTAWRVACMLWLRKENLITVTKNGKVLPYFA